ncbi:MAG: glutamate 5-kinase [Pirellulaceae bacterium]
MTSETTTDRNPLCEADTLVIKVGSRVLTNANGLLDIEQIANLSRQMAGLLRRGKRVVLVSSGAVAAGVSKLGLPARPDSLAMLQAVAAVGQAQLIQFYESFLDSYNLHAGQILLTAEDLDDRTRYLHVRNTLTALLDLGVVPIVNENDSVAVEELQTTFGDNDRLAATVAGVLGQTALIILSDVEGVFDQDPQNADAKIVHHIDAFDGGVFDMAVNRKTGVGKGGMGSKLRAAQLVTRGGSPVVIAGGRVDAVLVKLLDGEPVGTYFSPSSRGLPPRKRWIETAQVAGRLVVDDGAREALLQDGASLLAIGIAMVDGDFGTGEIVEICDASECVVGRGVVNYGSYDLRKILGLKSDAIAAALGRCPYSEVVHRDLLTIRAD